MSRPTRLTSYGVGKDMAELDVIFPIINAAGLGVLHGTRDEMAQAIEDAAKAGKGLFAMKALGGGNPLTDRKAALDYAGVCPASHRWPSDGNARRT